MTDVYVEPTAFTITVGNQQTEVIADTPQHDEWTFPTQPSRVAVFGHASPLAALTKTARFKTQTEALAAAQNYLHAYNEYLSKVETAEREFADHLKTILPVRVWRKDWT